MARVHGEQDVPWVSFPESTVMGRNESSSVWGLSLYCDLVLCCTCVVMLAPHVLQKNVSGVCVSCSVTFGSL